MRGPLVFAAFAFLAAITPASAFVLSFGSAGAQTGDQKIFINQLLDEFRKAHPDVDLELRDSTSYVKPILETLMSNVGETAPDLAVAGLIEWPMLQKKGLLRPLESVLSKAELSKIWKSFRPELTVQNYGVGVDPHEFALPFNRAVQVLFVNAALLPSIKDDKPLTWEQLAKALSDGRAKDQPHALAYRLAISGDDWSTESIMLNARGTPSLHSGGARLADPAALASIRQLHKMLGDKTLELVPAQHEAYVDFVEGRAAAALLSLSTIRSIQSRVKFPLVVTMHPRADTNATVIGGGDLVLPRSLNAHDLNEKRRKDIGVFLNWFYLGKGSGRWAEITGFLHTKKGSGPKPLYERQKFAVKSFYGVDDFCNVIFLRDGMSRAYREAILSDDPATVLGQAERFLKDLYAKPCK